MDFMLNVFLLGVITWFAYWIGTIVGASRMELRVTKAENFAKDTEFGFKLMEAAHLQLKESQQGNTFNFPSAEVATAGQTSSPECAACEDSGVVLESCGRFNFCECDRASKLAASILVKPANAEKSRVRTKTFKNIDEARDFAAFNGGRITYNNDGSCDVKYVGFGAANEGEVLK